MVIRAVLFLGVFLALQVSAVEFNADVRPIIFGKCVECHGPDKQKGGFRIDEAGSAVKEAESGAFPIVAGDPLRSAIIERVTSGDLDERMPPKGDALSVEQVATLREWIKSGAVYEKHWADQPVLRVAPPRKDVHPIDAFVQARLSTEGMRAHAEADRYTLARRAALDITGLPPAVPQLQAFVKDSAPDAYEKYLDRLFASAHYGEKWARWWLDLARYADTNGYESDEPRTMWAYRSWVIRALNQNLSFDQFTRMQMAGDLFEQPSLDDRIATGFHRNSLINTEGGSKEDEFKDAAIKDRVHTTFTVWMGATMECAQCHTHKYDPIEQKEYYQVYAFFNNTTDRGTGGESDTIDVPTQTPEDLARREAELVRLKSIAESRDAAFDQRYEAWLTSAEQARGEKPVRVWTVVDPASVTSQGGATLTRQPDYSFLASGKNPAKEIYEIRINDIAQPIAAFRLEALTDPSLPNQSLGRFSNGNFVLTDVQVALDDKPVKIREALADYAQGGYPIAAAIDKNPKSGWAVDGNVPDKRVNRKAVFRLSRPVSGTSLVLRLHFNSQFGQHSMGRFRMAVSSQSDAGLDAENGNPVHEIIALPREKRNEHQQQALLSHFRKTDPGSVDAQRAYEQAVKSLEAYKSKFKTKVMVMKEGKVKPAFLQDRGDFLQPRDPVQPGVPVSFGLPLPGKTTMNRLVLAEWLVHPENPRTARVTVNRFWDELFGRGLVTTSEDFGVQGELPTHPELLDWLAAEFVQEGWDVKALLKQIMMSATYRQDSRATEEELSRDYYNTLLARGPRFRGSAEMIRDIALQASGLLTPVVGGPSVYPPQPDSIWENLFIEGGLKKWPESMGPDRYRRGMYTYIKRTALHPMLRNFDAPSRSVCTVRRKRSNTPLAALNTLNDPAFVEFSGALALELVQYKGSVDAKIAEGFLRCASRPPRSGEVATLKALLAEEYKKYHEENEWAQALINSAFVHPPTVADSADLAAWIVVANVLLNMDATLTKG